MPGHLLCRSCQVRYDLPIGLAEGQADVCVLCAPLARHSHNLYPNTHQPAPNTVCHRYHGLSAKAQPADQFACRAHFAAGQLVAQLSSSCKGQQLVDGVQEAVQHIMRGVELASSNPRWVVLIVNQAPTAGGSDHGGHVLLTQHKHSQPARRNNIWTLEV